MKYALALTLLLGGAVSGQAPAFRTTAEIVRVDVAATRKGAPVLGLKASDFVVLDNGIRQDVDTVTLESNIPLEVALVLDTSGSVSGVRLSNLITACTILLSALKPADRVAVVAFSESVRSTGGWTNDFAGVARALKTLRGSGQTALRDAVEFALALPRTPSARGLMMVFSDGVDNISWLTDEEATDSAKRADMVAHAVTVSSSWIDTATFLDQLTKATGGTMWRAGSDSDLQKRFRQALDEMRSRYLVSYTPRGVSERGWHDLRVTLQTGKADILARPGYFSSSP